MSFHSPQARGRNTPARLWAVVRRRASGMRGGTV